MAKFFIPALAVAVVVALCDANDSGDYDDDYYNDYDDDYYLESGPYDYEYSQDEEEGRSGCPPPECPEDCANGFNLFPGYDGCLRCVCKYVPVSTEGRTIKKCNGNCSKHLDPICGSNGKTYGNPCTLAYASCLHHEENIVGLYSGQCKKGPKEEDEERWWGWGGYGGYGMGWPYMWG